MVSFRAPAELKEEVEELADRFEISASEAWRRLTAAGLETHAEAVGREARIKKLREEIIEFGNPIDMAGGFPGRCRQQFEQRFKNGYSPKWLAAKAENYRREARMLEEEVSEHPDAPEIEDGELVAEVEEELRQAIEAADLSNWNDRHENRYEKLTGVKDAKERREHYVLLVSNLVRTRRRLEREFSALGASRAIRPDDVHDLAAEHLPMGVDKEQVADAANHLHEHGVDPDDVEDALRDFDPRTWEVDDPTDDDTSSRSERPDPADRPGPDDQADADDEPDDDAPESDEDVVEWAAEVLRDGAWTDRDHFTDAKNKTRRKRARENSERKIEVSLENNDELREIMDQTTLTVTDVIELADEYNERRNDALQGNLTGPINPIAAKQTAAATDGGVRDE